MNLMIDLASAALLIFLVFLSVAIMLFFAAALTP